MQSCLYSACCILLMFITFTSAVNAAFEPHQFIDMAGRKLQKRIASLCDAYHLSG